MPRSWNVFSATGAFVRSKDRKKNLTNPTPKRGMETMISGVPYEFVPGVGFLQRGAKPHPDSPFAVLYLLKDKPISHPLLSQADYEQYSRDAYEAPYTTAVEGPLGNDTSSTTSLVTEEAKRKALIGQEFSLLEARAEAHRLLAEKERAQRDALKGTPQGAALRAREKAVLEAYQPKGRHLVEGTLAAEIEETLAGAGVGATDIALATKAAARERAKELAREVILERMPAASFEKRKRLPRAPERKPASAYVLSDKQAAGKYRTAPVVVLPRGY